MTDYYKELTADAPNAASGQGAPDYYQELTGGQPQGPPVPAQMNIQSEWSRGADIGDITKAGFASSPQEAIHYYAREMYPNEPVDQAIKRFGRTSGGEIYHVPDLNKPTEAFAVAPGAKALFGGVGKSLPVVGGTAATIATAPAATTGVGLALTMAAGASAAAAGETARQFLGDWLMDSPEQYRGLNTGGLGRETLYGGAGAMPGTGMIKHGQRHAARDIGRMSTPETRAAYEAAEQEGIPITAPEATGLPSMLAVQKRLSQRVATADKADAFYENRTGFIADAWDNFLSRIHQSVDVDALGRTAKDTAVGIIEGVMKKRSDIARESYGKVVRPGDTVPGLTLDPYVKKTIGELREAELTGRALKGLADNDIVVIDAVGKELKTQMNAAIRAGDNYRAGILKNLRNDLIGKGSHVDKMVPGYRPVRQEFANLSREVEEMTGSIITALSKIKDTELMKVGTEVLDPGRRSPELVRKAKQLISAASPEAWDGIVKVMMHTGSRQPFKTGQTGETINLAGKLFQKFRGDPFMYKNLKAAMDPAQWTGFNQIMQTLKRVSKVKPFGSDTAMNQEANREAAEKARGWLGKIFGNINPADALRNADDWLTARRLTRSDEKMAELIFDRAGDPTVIKAVKELRKLTPNSMRFRMLLGATLTRIAEQGEQEITGETIAPPLR